MINPSRSLGFSKIALRPRTTAFELLPTTVFPVVPALMLVVPVVDLLAIPVAGLGITALAVQRVEVLVAGRTATPALGGPILVALLDGARRGTAEGLVASEDNAVHFVGWHTERI